VDTEFTSYYGRPVVKKPHWVWPIWTYFWVGGITGGASAIATLAHFWGDKEGDRSIVQVGRYISMAGVGVSPLLLIIDLQRPERFLHMLRVVKFRSPLNMGTWFLTALGLATGLNFARQTVEDGLIPEDFFLGKIALQTSNDLTQAFQGLGGVSLGTYTGVLLSATTVPLWANADEALAPLFLSSAFSTGAAAITLGRALTRVKVEDLHRLDPIERAGIISELSCVAYAFTKLTPEVRQHVTQGPYANAFRAAVGLGMVGPLLLSLVKPKKGGAGRLAAIFTSLMALTGGFFLRYAIIEAGKTTSDDPNAYHSITQGPGRASPEEQARRYGADHAKAFEAGRSIPEARPNAFDVAAPAKKNGPSSNTGSISEDA
jgi:formate-dependent nitrite reductase membrane component NrfD